jgi:putative flippase GtrA
VLTSRFARFLLVGCLATGIQYAVLVLLVRTIGTDPTVASALGFVISAGVNYIVNYHYTFGSNERHSQAALKFATLAVAGLLINSASMHLLLLAGWHYLLAQALTTAIVLLWNFTGNSVWTFRPTAARESNSAGLAHNKDLIAILLLTAAIRAVVFLLSDNEAGDADARALLSGSWAHDPTLIRAGVWLPFHFYVTGILSWIFGSPIFAGKVLAFVTGSLTVIPLFLLTQHLFDRRTAQIAGLMFAVYGLHVELSSVVMSEAPSAFCMLGALYLFLRESQSELPRFAGFAAAGVLLAIAGGFRQEPWLLTGILAIYMLLKPALRRYAVQFGLIGLSTFILWDIANATAGQGDFHALTAVAHSKANEAKYTTHFSAVHNVLKWILIFVRSPGPVISALAAAGMILAFRRRLPSDLAWIALMLILPFAALSIVKPEWAPQDRYTIFFAIFVLPYAAAAATAAYGKRNIPTAAVVAIISISFVTQCAVYIWRFHAPLPVPDYNANDVTAWKWLAANAAADSVVVEDTDWRAPGLIAHSATYDRVFHIVYSFKGPEALQDAIEGSSRPLLLVLHSPLSKWAFLESLRPRLVFQNPDYRILEIEPALARDRPGMPCHSCVLAGRAGGALIRN